MSSLTKFTIEEPHTTVILKEMFKRVGAAYEGFDLTKPNWFHDYEWTQKEEDEFVEWLADYLVKNKLAHKGWYRGEKYHTHQARKIVSSYGWKLKELEDTNG